VVVSKKSIRMSTTSGPQMNGSADIY